MTEKWQDKCTSIKQTDSNFAYSQKLVKGTGCLQQNNKLTQCLQNNKKDWRMCQAQNLRFAQCLKNSKS